jgi:hypothetical protein
MVEGGPVTGDKLLLLMEFAGGIDQEQRYMFQKELMGFDSATAAEFLRFATTRTRIPLNSQCDDAEGRNAFRITVDMSGNEGAFFMAHTCDNSANMGMYGSQEELQEKLLRSMRESEGFDWR